MKLTAHGVKYEIEREALDAIAASSESALAPRVIRGCKPCRAVCFDERSSIGVPAHLCRCCGERSMPTGEQTHFVICTIEQLAQRFAA